MQAIKNRVLPVGSIKEIADAYECARQLIKGYPLLLLEDCDRALLLKIAKWEKRSVEEPQTEPSLRGPREGFTESISTNLSLLRRKIQSVNLKLKSFQFGRYTETEVYVAYLEGIVQPALIREVENRLKRIDMDSVLETGYIEELTEDTPYSPFPQQQFTERVDIAAAGLLDGRIVILVDGTPNVLIVPVTLVTLLQAADDYYNRSLYSSALRILRYCTLFISLTLPAVYVALLNFHQEMIPSKLLMSIASSREEIPFPTIVEVLMMQLAFEVLREAGLRLPRQIGSAVTIVGALVVGEAAVSAGLVSAPIVIIIALYGHRRIYGPSLLAGILRPPAAASAHCGRGNARNPWRHVRLDRHSHPFVYIAVLRASLFVPDRTVRGQRHQGLGDPGSVVEDACTSELFGERQPRAPRAKTAAQSGKRWRKLKPYAKS